MKPASDSEFDPESFDGDLLIFSIPKAEVLSGRIGKTVDRLMRLTDSRESILKWRSKVALSFDGWEDDPRPMCESPEMVTFFRDVTRQFPHWLHFCEKQGNSLPIVFSLLCDFKDGQPNLPTVITALASQMNALYLALGLDKKDFEAVLNDVRSHMDG